MAITFQNGQVVSTNGGAEVVVELVTHVTLNEITIDIDYGVDARHLVEQMRAMPTFMARSTFERILGGDFVDKATLLGGLIGGKRIIIYDDTLDNSTPDWMYPVIKGGEVELEYFPTWEKLDSWDQHHEYDFPSAY